MEWVKLGEIGEIITGNTPSKKNKEFYLTEDINFISPADIKDFKKINFLYSSENFISNKAKDKARIAPRNSILVTCIGNIGKVAKVQLSEVAFNQQINAIIIDNKRYSIDYIAYALIFNQKRMESIANAPVVPIINKKDFSKFKIKIEKSIKKQNQISNSLNNIGNLINIRKEQIQAYDDLIEGLFFQFQFYGEKIFLKNIIEINPSKSKVKSLDSELLVSFVPMQDVTEKGELNLRQERKLKDVYKGFTYFENNDVVVAKITPSFENGKSALMRNLTNNIGFGTTEFHVLRIKDFNKINPYWLFYLTRSKQFLLYGENQITGSAGQKRIPKNFIENFKAKVPPIELQNKFAEYVIKIEEEKKKLRASLNEFEILFDALMEDAFSGNLFKE